MEGLEGLQVEWETDADPAEHAMRVEWETDDGSYRGSAHPGDEWSKYNEQFEQSMRDERAAKPNLRQRGGPTARAGGGGGRGGMDSPADGLADEPVIDPQRLDELKLRVRSRALQKRVESIMNCYYVVMTVRAPSFAKTR